MTKEKFDGIVKKVWKECICAINEEIDFKNCCVSYENYKNIDGEEAEKELWNNTIADFTDAYVVEKTKFNLENRNYIYSYLEDFLDDLWR